MSNEEQFGIRCRARLLRFARLLAPEGLGVTAAHFDEEVWLGTMAYEVLNTFDLAQFRRLGRRERPSSCGGLLRWRLRPRSAEVLAHLGKIVAGGLAGCCASDAMFLRHWYQRNQITYRFILIGDSHAHVGCLRFGGPLVRRCLRIGGLGG